MIWSEDARAEPQLYEVLSDGWRQHLDQHCHGYEDAGVPHPPPIELVQARIVAVQDEAYDEWNDSFYQFDTSMECDSCSIAGDNSFLLTPPPSDCSGSFKPFMDLGDAKGIVQEVQRSTTPTWTHPFRDVFFICSPFRLMTFSASGDPLIIEGMEPGLAGSPGTPSVYTKELGVGTRYDRFGLEAPMCKCHVCEFVIRPCTGDSVESYYVFYVNDANGQLGKAVYWLDVNGRELRAVTGNYQTSREEAGKEDGNELQAAGGGIRWKIDGCNALVLQATTPADLDWWRMNTQRGSAETLFEADLLYAPVTDLTMEGLGLCCMCLHGIDNFSPSRWR